MAPRRACLAAALALAALGPLATVRAAGPADAVSLATARAEVAAGRAVLIDIREPDEHATGVAPGARLLPLSQLPGRVSEIPTDASKPVLLICGTQNRSRKLLDSLRERGGYGHVRYVEGGMTGWARSEFPMVKPKP